MPAEYQIGFLGADGGMRAQVQNQLAAQITTLGLDASSLIILDEASVGRRNRKHPFVAVFFGYDGADDFSSSAIDGLDRR